VEDVAIIGVPDDRWGEAGMAFIIPRDGAAVTEEEVIGFCKDRLAGYKLPKRIIFVESLPRTSLGKVRKYLLKEEVLLGGQEPNRSRRGVKRESRDSALCGGELCGVNRLQSTQQKEAIP